LIITTRRALFGLAAAYIASQGLPATRLVYWPSEVWMNETQVTMDRTFPGDWIGLPRPRISFTETVDPLSQKHNSGQVCEVKGGPFRYESDAPLGRWRIGKWAAPCLDDPEGYRWSAQWTWHLGGITLGPTSISKVFINNGASE
jgi:hypothetical protein